MDFILTLKIKTMEWLLCAIGIILSFGIKFFNKSKDGGFSASYWWKDNRIELALSTLVAFLAMVIYTNPDTVINADGLTELLSGLVPGLAFIQYPLQMIVPIIIGWSCNEWMYKLAKRKKEQGLNQINVTP